MNSLPPSDDAELIAGLRRGVERDVERFLELAATAVWTPVVALAGEKKAEQTFCRVIAALSADGYARLARYDGRSRLSTFLALATREYLGEELAHDCASDPRAAWPGFDRFFRNDIRRCISRRFPRDDQAKLDDEYQGVCIKLIENDYRRIRSFDGSGGFIGYILRVVNRLLIDRLRQEASGRRRLPAEIERMGKLEQAVFVARAWIGLPPVPELIAASVQGKLDGHPSVEQIAQALNRLGPAIASARSARARPEHTPSDLADDEAFNVADPGAAIDETLIELEQQRRSDALIERVQREASGLPGELHRYLRLVFDLGEPTPPRELARLMGVAATDIYKLQQQAKQWLKQFALSQ